MKVAIIKYNAGNIFSVLYALKRIGVEAVVTDDFETIKNADKVIFPGVGEASSAMAYLKEKGLDKLIKNLKQPVLGICIGMQLLCRYSEEGNVDCMGIFDVPVKKFDNSTCPKQKIPHMGWNTISIDKENDIITPDINGAYTYFVHSYHAPICNHTVASCDYITPFSAVLQKDNFYATQFHPEKSGDIGEVILKNFTQL